MQALITYLIVATAMVYAAWLLMPQALRRRLVAYLKSVVPASRQKWIARLERASEETGCTTCKACATDEKSLAPQIKTVEFHRR
ncbi:MAG TPA: hypothetical protein VEW72_00075 [Burkholderiales bacterium]|nr:hypothetical protein [Burkholderiales bacterium]